MQNVKDPLSPLLLQFPPGQGEIFQNLVNSIKTKLSALLPNAEQMIQMEAQKILRKVMREWKEKMWDFLERNNIAQKFLERNVGIALEEVGTPDGEVVIQFFVAPLSPEGKVYQRHEWQNFIEGLSSAEKQNEQERKRQEIQKEMEREFPSEMEDAASFNVECMQEAQRSFASAEQTYGTIEGDNATTAMLLALLSSLSEKPIRQDLAITGSTDKKGTIEAVGRVNEKVEGFFKVCKKRGLSGSQGVIIPKANKGNLMLSEEVIDAVKNDKFHVYAVETVEEALELLTGCSWDEIDQAINTKFQHWYTEELERKLREELRIKERLAKEKRRKRFFLF